VGNERGTSEFARHIAESLARYSEKAKVAVELRAEKRTRPTAAATTRDSVIRIVDQLDDALPGICWDVAHDFENFVMSGSEWNLPDPAFLSRVSHLHVHDIGDDGEAHCPLTIGRVPIENAITACNNVPVIMEIRWRMAERMGDPWDVLAESYRTVRNRTSDSFR
jgi:sugar phosphate isomerase/epimerase